MANSTVRRSVNRDRRRAGQEKSKSLPLITRRFAAWTVEVSLIITSAVVPFGLGVYTQARTEGTQPINPVLAIAEDAITTTLALPPSNRPQQVAPLTNWLWTGALVAPIILSSWQLYLLAKTGSTLPKRWFGVRVVTAAGNPAGMRRILLREVVGAWGVPLLVAYILWHFSSTFPSLGMLAGFSLLTLLGEGISARFNRYRRCWHDLLAGTYVVDANRSYAALLGNLRPATSPLISQYAPYAAHPVSPTVTMATAVLPRKRQKPDWWRWMRRNPGFVILFITLSSMAAVLGTLVGTQVYIQTQANQRQLRQQNSQQFLELVQKLSDNAPTTVEERRKAITALGTINDPQALQMLVDLLGQETDPLLLDTIQQTIASTGLRVIPHLRRSNQSIANALDYVRYSSKPEELTLHQQRLEATQRAIANLLSIYSGHLNGVDLSRTILGENLTDSALPFALFLDNVNLSGIQLRGANLNQGSLRGTQWRSVGEDRRWNTADDRIADLSDAQLKAANLTEANLSRIAMHGANLTHAILNRANLAGTNLMGANLSSTQIVGANLQDVVLENASLTGTDLAAADLSRANLRAARLGRASALGTQLQYANATASDWRGADLSGADLSHANLKDADLSDSRLSGVSFRNAQLQNTNLRNADLRKADLRGAQLVQTDMQGAILFKSPSPDQFIQAPPEAMLSAIIEGVDFSNAKNLDAKQLAYICTQGGRHPRCP